MPILALSSILSLLGCPSITDAEWAARIDQDGDGFAAIDYGGDDCDDGNKEINPAATEIPYDLIDSNCDGLSDNDADGDGHGDGAHGGDDCDDTNPDVFPGAAEACDGLDGDCDGEIPADEIDTDGDGQGICAGDCDDDDAGAFTGGVEICDDKNIDEDCDGSVDDADADATEKSTWYRDSDGDGYGDPDSSGPACDAPAGFVANGDDCDDSDENANPDTQWYADSDGDGFGDSEEMTTACEQPTEFVSEFGDCDDSDGTVYPGAAEIPYDGIDGDCAGDSDFDADADGYASAAYGGDDCDDTSGYIHPGATETCDGADDDCDGAVDLDESDNDGDGYRGCGGDCDDTLAASNPGESEICDALNIDEDCDGSIDDGDASATGKSEWYRDSDEDGYGDPAILSSACDAPAGFVDNADDCEDGDARISPETAWYADIDSDGFGDSTVVATQCEQPVGYVADSGDCDDADAAINPDAAEVCNGIDDNCVGGVDAADTRVEPSEAVWFRDRDDDGYGDDRVSVVTCTEPTGYVHASGDCDDSASGINAGADEVCDLEDNDCDGQIDDADTSVTDQRTWYGDSDGDAWGDSADIRISCFEPTGYVLTSGDCDDLSNGINPSVSEECDTLDNDCDGLIDDADPGVVDQSPWYADLDADSYGDASSSVVSCDPGAGWQLNDDDCDDTDVAVNPSAAESWYDGVDQDCDGLSDDDQDVDGYDASVYGGDDCNDVDAAIRPDATEGWYDGVDQDCDGLSDYDQDYDGHDAEAWGGDDCDDTVAGTYPGATETWYDGVDSDCDGASDYDQDGDGYDSDVYAGDDCADTSASVNPGTPELVGDGLDNDCDGITDGIDLVDSDAILTGVTASDSSGTALAGAGDNNGDGYDDILVGAPAEDGGASNGGAVYLVRGPISGTASLSTARAKIVGENANDYAGNAVAFCDANGDGMSDILIGAPYEDSGGSSSGAAYLLSGPSSGTIDLSAASAKFIGENGSDGAGDAVSCADVNNDGKGDILIGAHYNATGSVYGGAVYVIHGPKTGSVDLSAATAKYRAEGNGDYVGEDVAGLGDVDGDGFEDFVIGAENNYAGGSQAGAAYLITGPITTGTSVLSAADAKFIGEDAYDYAGEAVARAGDIDGDGKDDILIGGEGDDTTGSTCGAGWLITSHKTGSVDLSLADAKITGEGTEDYVGIRVTGNGDINGDGYGELTVASYFDGNYGDHKGTAWLFAGPVSGTFSTAASDMELAGSSNNDYASQGLAGFGDQDADGMPDLLVGAPGSDIAASYAGSTYWLSGGSLF